MLQELDMSFKAGGRRGPESSGDNGNKAGKNLEVISDYGTDTMTTEGPRRGEKMEVDVQTTIKNFSVRTRAQMIAAKQFAMEAGILPPEMQTSTQGAFSSANVELDSKDEDSDDELGYNRVSVPRNPWPEVDGAVSRQLWLQWDVAQGQHLHRHHADIHGLHPSIDKLVRILESHQYNPKAGRPPYPNLLKDLCSRQDFEGNDASPRTFEPEMKHFQQFDVLLATLQEYGKGRDVGFVKIKIPEEAMSTPVNPRLDPEELMMTSYCSRLKPVHKHPAFDVDGMFEVVRSKTPNEESAMIWRMIMDDFDRETLATEGEIPSKLEVSQEVMLDPIGRQEVMTFSFDNEGKFSTSLSL
ncbi:MAG: hypothetical protein Q9216_004132 [Gyalolechia sp. 2 TL-2023]